MSAWVVGRASISPARRSQQGDRQTAAQGLRVDDTDHSLKAGPWDLLFSAVGGFRVLSAGTRRCPGTSARLCAADVGVLGHQLGLRQFSLCAAGALRSSHAR